MMPIKSTAPRQLTLAVVAIAALSSQPAVGPASAADKLMQVDWSSEEISAFVAERAAAAATTPRTSEQIRLDKLRLPVLGFDRVPTSISRSLAPDVRPERKRTIIMDDDNPVWYQLVDRYGDVVVTVEADLRIQQELPASTPLYGAGGPGASPQATISVFDGRSEPGMEGAISEYTLYKFPAIPYKVSIECTPESVATCRDLEALASDQSQLKLLAAQPPR